MSILSFSSKNLTLLLCILFLCTTFFIQSVSAYPIEDANYIDSVRYDSSHQGFREPENSPTPLFLASIQTCPSLTKTMSIGSKDSLSNGEVSLLQQYLRQDTSLYPEGDVTGFYGKATERAVQRFQTRHAIVTSGTPDTTGYGMVGRSTRAKITELCTTSPTTQTTPTTNTASPYTISQVASVTKTTNTTSTTYTVTLKDGSLRTITTPKNVSTKERTALFKAAGYKGTPTKLIAKVKKEKKAKVVQPTTPSRGGGTTTPSPSTLPICDAFTATPPSLPSTGGTVVLKWNTTNATAVTIDQAVGTVVVDGTKSIPVTTTKTFTLSASNNSGNIACTVTVTVQPSPTVTSYTLADVTTITSKVVGQNTIYSLSLVTGKKFDISVLTLATVAVRDKAFADTGYTDAVSVLLAKMSNPLLSAYVETPITQAQMCSVRWQLPLPSSFSTELKKASTTPFRYSFDFTNNIHRNHEDLYGYTPKFGPGIVSFSAMGQPLIVDRSFNMQYTAADGTWKKINIVDIARESFKKQGIKWDPAKAGAFGPTALYAHPYADMRVIYDTGCNAYIALNASRSSLNSSVLLHSFDGGHSWAAYKIPGSTGFNIGPSPEVSMSQHSMKLAQAPAIMLVDAYQNGALKVVIPIKNADKTLGFSGPFTITSNAFALVPQAGNDTYMTSNGDNLHVVFSQEEYKLDPISGRHGVAQYAATLSRSSGEIISGPTLIGVGVGPADIDIQNPNNKPDSHSQPAIAQDSKGYLHIVIGGHGAPIYYRKSTNPNDTSSWGPIEVPGEKPTTANPAADQYTYPSLVIGANDAPMIVARWTGLRYIFRLVSLQRTTSGIWNQKVILDPGRAFYGNWYHKLSIDTWGRVFINNSYYAGNLFDEEVSAFANTYGITFSGARRASTTDSRPCLPAPISATVDRHYCNYDVSMNRINEEVLMMKANGNFDFLTTEKAFKSF